MANTDSIGIRRHGSIRRSVWRSTQILRSVRRMRNSRLDYLSGYAKIGVTRACAKYVYYDDNNNEKAKIEAAKFIPFFCVGLEKKFTPKWGVALEVDVSIKKEYKKQRGDYLHKIKLSRNCVRLMATYSMSLNK